MHKKIIATGAVLSLLAATPVIADSNTSHKGESHLGFNLGSIVRVLAHEQGDDRKEENAQKHENKGHASSTATTTVSVAGNVSAISGTTLTLQGKNGAVYTVNAANASVSNGVLADIKVGDTVKVNGTLSGTVILATKIKDGSIQLRKFEARVDNFKVGVISAVSGAGFTITTLGSGASTSVTTNASTTYKAGGKATTSAAVHAGSLVIVEGTTTSTTTPSFAASIVTVINHGFGFLKHLFHVE